MNLPGPVHQPPTEDELYRRLMHGGMKLRPWEIRRMTLQEIAWAMDEDLDHKRPPAGGITFTSYAEKLAWVERRRRMTIRERLQEARNSP